jgi:hypothetical protein
MTSIAEENKQIVVKFVQEILLSEDDKSTITPTLILEKIKVVVAMNPKWGVDLEREAVVGELIRRFSMWIGVDTILTNSTGHQEWLNSSRKTDWRYWQRYREWLERKLSWKAVEGIDKSTDNILGLLEDPNREEAWDRRGLVVGHVQSGKTGNYTALISKAADAGYKIIIVLAGLHNNLRSQTQIRLEEGFLGYETSSDYDTRSLIGVGEIDSDKEIIPNCATDRSNNGDFSQNVARRLAISPEERPWLFVVKKNKTVLRELLRWVQNHVADTAISDQEKSPSSKSDLPRVKAIVTKLPLLIIDDEADHASVDTEEQLYDDEGNPDPEHSPTAINKLIRRILHSFSRSSYVGYTATPFANIFIHEKGLTTQEGEDLFPSAFIINLAAPSNYVGPSKVFGLINPEGVREGLPLQRTAEDASSADGLSGWMPRKHKNGYVPYCDRPSGLPKSLDEAINAFILTCTIRKLRGQGTQHCSMLIHVTRFNSVQREVFNQIEDRLRHVRQRILRKIDHEQIISDLKTLWESDFLPTSSKVQESFDESPQLEFSWQEIIEALPLLLADIEVRMINGSAKDALDYENHDERGLKVIAIGGDKLSRGLTLEGLCVSYFLRASKMYDTLMQMGRWFGYRPGYLDLCRLYTTNELSEWFGHIADAAEELREEFDLMASNGATPRQYGLKVQSHSVLMVTSRLKMRTAKNLMLSFSGQLLETIALYRDRDTLQNNFNFTKRLINNLGKPEIDPERVRGSSRQKWKGYLWQDVEANEIVDFLTSYKTHSDAYKVNSQLLGQFVQSMTLSQELTNWTVALIGGGEGAKCEISDSVEVSMLKRLNNSFQENRYSIGRLLSQRDEAIDLDEGAWKCALEKTRNAWHADPARMRDTKEPDVPNGPAIREVRGFGGENVQAHPERGLLLLYALDPEKSEVGFTNNTPPIIAFGISFPGSNSGTKVEYKVNNVGWEQEYGPSE